MLQHTDAQFDEVLTKRALALLEDKSDFAVASQGAIPMIPTEVYNGTYKVWKAADFRRRNVEKRANGAEFKRVNLGVEDKSFSCVEEGYEVPVADRNRLPMEMEDTTAKMVEDGFAQFDIRLAEKMTTSVFTEYRTGHATTADSTHFIQWNKAAATPITDIKAYKKVIKQKLGVEPDSLLISEDTFTALTENAQILARMSSYTDKDVTKEKLAMFFGLKNIYVMASAQTTTADGQATQTVGGIAPDRALLYYRGTTDGALIPSTVKCFYNTANYGAGSNGIIIQTYREEKITSDIARIVQDFVVEVSMPEGGLLLDDVLA